jgi:hypothetical protein
MLSHIVFQLGRPAIVIAALTGTLAGAGAFTFDYGEGLSYFSADPLACRNCHVMNDQYASWTKGPHHAVARCVDCHLPHEVLLEVPGEGRQRLPAFEGLHLHGLSRAHSDHAAQLADLAGQLPALSHRFRSRHRPRRDDRRRDGVVRTLSPRRRSRRAPLKEIAV